jgi:2-haloacid dehalogenase
VSDERLVQAVLFDLFGTLLSLAPLDDVCDRLARGRGAEIAARWRARQLEASWLRTAMERWADFDVVTVEALAATLDELSIQSPPDLAAVADAFAELPLADGAEEAVRALDAEGLVTGVLTNASTRTMEAALARHELPLQTHVSVDAARRFKPHPSVYELAVDATGVSPDRIGFVTANGWDAAGASTFGFRVAWLRSSQTASMPSVGAPLPTEATWAELPRIFAG